jgi:hypothetical protein
MEQAVRLAQNSASPALDRRLFIFCSNHDLLICFFFFIFGSEYFPIFSFEASKNLILLSFEPLVGLEQLNCKIV